MMKRIFLPLFLMAMLPALLLQISCDGDDPEPQPYGKLVFNFHHKVDGVNIIFDSIMYTNHAGNVFGVNEIQYFLSDITLHKKDGSSYLIDAWKDYVYVDTDIPSTLIWEVFDSIPVSDYDSISFTFGFDQNKNQSFMFVNPPENGMVWPEYLGGGYHYLKLNMKWIGQGGLPQGNAFHLGIGQIYDNQGNITGFVHNHFKASFPASDFSMVDKGKVTIDVVMNVEQWFKDPNTFDFDVWGGDIMQNQSAMAAASENGRDVFSISSISNK